jgi:hypothetical protein
LLGNSGAVNEYESLRRELTTMSRRQNTNISKEEEGQPESDEFNLDEYLHGYSKQIDENGNKRKHLGVSWESLHVEVRTKNMKLIVIIIDHVSGEYRALALMHLRSQMLQVSCYDLYNFGDFFYRKKEARRSSFITLRVVVKMERCS